MGETVSFVADLLIVTFWSTTKYISFFEAQQVLYLIQSDERLFYDDPFMKKQVSQTYEQKLPALCIAPWLATMMKEEFNNALVRCVPNLIEDMFYDEGAFLPIKTSPSVARKVIIEGPTWPAFKNFAPTVRLFDNYAARLTLITDRHCDDLARRADSYHINASREMIRKLFLKNDFLVKLSDVESFCLPAIEAMASGCAVIIKQPAGDIEFLEPNENCIIVKNGEEAIEAIESLFYNHDLYSRIINGGFRTAARYQYSAVKETLLSTYEDLLRGRNVELNRNSSPTFE